MIFELATKLPSATIVARQHRVEIYRRESTMKVEKFCGPIQHNTKKINDDWVYDTRGT